MQSLSSINSTNQSFTPNDAQQMNSVIQKVQGKEHLTELDLKLMDRYLMQTQDNTMRTKACTILAMASENGQKLSDENLNNLAYVIDNPALAYNASVGITKYISIQKQFVSDQILERVAEAICNNTLDIDTKINCSVAILNGLQNGQKLTANALIPLEKGLAINDQKLTNIITGAIALTAIAGINISNSTVTALEKAFANSQTQSNFAVAFRVLAQNAKKHLSAHILEQLATMSNNANLPEDIREHSAYAVFFACNNKQVLNANVINNFENTLSSKNGSILDAVTGTFAIMAQNNVKLPSSVLNKLELALALGQNQGLKNTVLAIKFIHEQTKSAISKSLGEKLVQLIHDNNVASEAKSHIAWIFHQALIQGHTLDSSIISSFGKSLQSNDDMTKEAILASCYLLTEQNYDLSPEIWDGVESSLLRQATRNDAIITLGNKAILQKGFLSDKAISLLSQISCDADAGVLDRRNSLNLVLHTILNGRALNNTIIDNTLKTLKYNHEQDKNSEIFAFAAGILASASSEGRKIENDVLQTFEDCLLQESPDQNLIAVLYSAVKNQKYNLRPDTLEVLASILCSDNLDNSVLISAASTLYSCTEIGSTLSDQVCLKLEEAIIKKPNTDLLNIICSCLVNQIAKSGNASNNILNTLQQLLNEDKLPSNGWVILNSIAQKQNISFDSLSLDKVSEALINKDNNNLIRQIAGYVLFANAKNGQKFSEKAMANLDIALECTHETVLQNVSACLTWLSKNNIELSSKALKLLENLLEIPNIQENAIICFLNTASHKRHIEDSAVQKLTAILENPNAPIASQMFCIRTFGNLLEKDQKLPDNTLEALSGALLNKYLMQQAAESLQSRLVKLKFHDFSQKFISQVYLAARSDNTLVKQLSHSLLGIIKESVQEVPEGFVESIERDLKSNPSDVGLVALLKNILQHKNKTINMDSLEILAQTLNDQTLTAQHKANVAWIIA